MNPGGNKKVKRPEGMSQKVFEKLSSVADELAGKDLFPEANAEAKEILKRLIYKGTSTKPLQ